MGKSWKRLKKAYLFLAANVEPLKSCRQEGKVAGKRGKVAGKCTNLAGTHEKVAGKPGIVSMTNKNAEPLASHFFVLRTLLPSYV